MKNNSIEKLKIEHFLSSHVKEMIAAIEKGEPPLNGVMEEMEAKKLINMVNDDEHFEIGRMVTKILAPYGYYPLKQSNGKIKTQKLTKSKTIKGQQLFVKSGKAIKKIRIKGEE